MPAKAAFVKGILMAAADPEMAAKTLLAVLMVILSFLLLVVSPFVLVLSTPLAPSAVMEAYEEETEIAIMATADGYDGAVEIDWRAVLVLDAVRFRQDFSHVENALLLPPMLRELFMREIRELALKFVELVEFREVTRHVGYENVYNEEGEVIGERPVYVEVKVPVYRLRSLEEVAELLGFTAEEQQWAATMMESLR
ncbi:MAG: hypothetical protein KGZ53_03660 [Peptococcaceae bacterium]|nr:hypothetical protein [Peptococcaceae bacterium]